MFEYGDYFYLFWSSGSCCSYDSDRPAPGDEYKVMVCRSSSATGGFVSVSFSFSYLFLSRGVFPSLIDFTLLLSVLLVQDMLIITTMKQYIYETDS